MEGISISEDARAGTPATAETGRQPASGTGWLVGGRYRVVDRLGSGGMAEVFRAHDELLSRQVAIKLFKDRSAAPDSPGGVEREETELRALAQLNHPNLIALYDGAIADTDGKTYLIMELVDGPSLADRLEEGPLSEAQACEVGRQIADALSYVHAAGMVHRDVKPANILLGTDVSTGDSTVRARLSDFGIVRLLDNEQITRADLTVGTASYLAPEQARGSAVEPSADIYALGLVLIEALTGVRSFEGPAIEAMVARLTRDPDIPADLPPPWPRLLAAMTAADPDARPTAAQVAAALRDRRAAPELRPVVAPLAMVAAEAADGAVDPAAVTATVPPAPAPPASDTGWPTEPPRGRHLSTWLVAAAVLLAVLGMGGVLLLAGGPAADDTSGTHRVHLPNAGSSSSRQSRHNVPVTQSMPRSSSSVVGSEGAHSSAASRTGGGSGSASSKAGSTSAAPSSSGPSSSTSTSAAPSSSGVSISTSTSAVPEVSSTATSADSSAPTGQSSSSGAAGSSSASGSTTPSGSSSATSPIVQAGSTTAGR